MPQDRDLATVLTQLEQGWQELARLLRNREQFRGRIIQAEQVVLVDGQGEVRGKLGVQEDGSWGLVWLDQTGSLRAWLGLKTDGSASLSLKDAAGRVLFETPGAPRAATGADSDREPAAPESDSREVRARLEQIGKDLAEFRKLLAPPPAGAGTPISGAAARAETSPEADPQTLARLEQVERQNRRVKFAGGVLLALWLVTAAGLGVALHRSFQPKDIVTAQTIALKDPTGLTRVWLGTREGEVSLELFDPRGKRRTALAVGTSGAPVLALFNGEERVQAQLGLAPDGAVRLDFFDPAGQKRTTLGLGPGEVPALWFYDQGQKLRAQLGLAPDGDPGLNLVDQAGLLRVALGRIDPRYQPPQSPLERPLSSLVLFNQEGIPVWRAPFRWRR